MAPLADVFRVLNGLKTQGVLQEYALGGAMAMVFWAEPTATFDVDIFVFLPDNASPLVSLEPLYSALRSQGYEAEAEHVLIHGTPVQFIPSPNPLADEAIEQAAEQQLEGVPFRVMRPAHLAALWLQAGGAKRRERVEMLRQAGVLDEALLEALLRKHGARK